MWDFWSHLLDSSGFQPRWQDGDWPPSLGWLHLVSDLGIGSAYLAISCILVFFIIRRKDIAFRGVLILLVPILVMVGLTQLMEVALFWWPAYRLSGVLKCLTALVSWATVFALVRTKPQTLGLSQPSEWKKDGALEASERRGEEWAEELAMILDAMPAAVFISQDPDCLHMTGNRTADELMRLPRGAEVSLSAPEEIKPRHFKAIKDGRELRTEELPAQRAAKGITLDNFEFTLVFDDGTAREMLAYAKPLRDQEGNSRGAITVLVDVTERKRAEAELQESKERLRLAIEVAGLGVMRIDYSAGTVDTSPLAAELFDLPVGKAVTRDLVHDRFHPDDRVELDRLIAQCLDPEGDGWFALEHRIVRTDGSIRWLSVRKRVFFEGNSPHHAVLIAADITERRQAEMALRASEERFRLTIESGSMGTFEVDLEAGESIWNDIEFKLLGLRPGEVRATPEAFFRYVHPDDVKTLQEQWEFATRSGKFDAEFRIVRTDGQIRWLAGAGTFFWGAQVRAEGVRTLKRFLGVNYDITERKRAEETLREERDRLTKIAATAPGVLLSFRVKPDGSMSFPYAAPGVIGLYGLSPEELAKDGAPIFQVINPADGERIRKSVAVSAATMEPWLAQYRVCRPGCVEIWVEGHSAPVREADGGTLWHGFVTDITQRKRNEEVLRFQHALLRSQSEASQDGILIVGPDNRVLSYNRRFLIVWALPEELLASRDDKPILTLARSRVAHPDEFIAGVAAIYADREALSHDEVKLADGRVLDRYSAPIRGESGDYLGRVWYFRDITERKRSEIALRESEERYRRLMDMLPEAVLISAGERIVFCNPACLPLFEAAVPSQLLSRTLFDLFHPDHQPLVRQRTATLLETSEASRSMEATIVRMDGRLAPVNIVATPIVDQGENAILLAISDQTERERSLALLESVLNSVHDAIITINDQGAVQSVNPATQSLFGYPESEMIGANIGMLMPASYRNKYDQHLANSRLGEEAKIIGIDREISGQRKDGTTFPVELTVTEFHLHGERYFTGVMRDITARKQLEEQFHQAQKMEAVGQLAGGVAHDFNNLLTIINGYAELALLKIGANDPVREQIQEITTAGERAAGLTRQLLTFSRKAIIEPKILDLNAVIVNVDKMLRRILGEDIQLTFLCDPELGGVKADSSQIEQVLMNLVVNARDAMPLGGKLNIELRNIELDDFYIREHADAHRGHYVLLTVSDTGCGMDRSTMSRIFEPFFTTKGGKGTGPGLATVHGIIKQNGGHIDVASEVGQGTTFKIYFPSVEQPTPALSTVTESAASPRGNNEVVLLVEDEERVRSLARLALQSSGYAVLEARDGLEALQVAGEHRGPIDLLVTDVIMPRMGGREAAKLLMELRPTLKVLFMSGYTDDAIVRHGILESEVAFLQKPFTPRTLASKVRQVMDSVAKHG